jgi:hypothetical protein
LVTTAKIQVEVFWTVTPNIDVVGYQRFAFTLNMEAAWCSETLVPITSTHGGPKLKTSTLNLGTIYLPKSRDSSVGRTLGYGLDDRGIFLFTTASRTVLGYTQPPIQWVPGALYLGVKRPGREAHHSPPSSAEIKE